MWFESSRPTRIEFVKEILPLVEPDLGQACVIVVDHADGSAGKRVGRGFAKHVTHVTTGGYLYRAAAHPHLDRRSAIGQGVWGAGQPRLVPAQQETKQERRTSERFLSKKRDRHSTFHFGVERERERERER